MNGKLIVIDGLDGSGKSTQAPLLVDALNQRGHRCREISFPDYNDPSSALVRMYLSGAFGADAGAVNAYAASSFYAVDRYAAFHRHWGQDWKDGTWIVSARYTSSNAAHQMGKLPREEWNAYLEWLEDYEYRKLAIPRPDAVLFLDMPVEVAQKLVLARYHGDQKKKDLHERDASYLYQCREAALYAAQKLGWKVVSCSREGNPLSRQEVHEKLLQALDDVWKDAGQ